MAANPAESESATPKPPMPPERSGPKALVVVAALVLVFLGALWYASFVALQARGPDRAFFTKESWQNGTVVLTLTELDEKGEVLLSSITVNITSQADEQLYGGPPGRTENNTNYTLTVGLADNDHSSTLTLGDQVVIQAVPASASDSLILATFYLYSDGREWSRMPLT